MAQANVPETAPRPPPTLLMRPWLKRTLAALGIVLSLAGAGVLITAHSEAHRLITNPRATRHVPTKTPADFGMPFEDAGVTTADGLNLVGWYVPPRNGVTVIFVHGYKDSRGTMLAPAAMYYRHGYGALIVSLRAHDLSDGSYITFGYREMEDMDAWYRFATLHPGVDPGRIAILGVSMGGAIAIEYAARNSGVKAVIADSAFSSMEDTIATSVRFFTGLPPFPFANLIGWFAEREGGFSMREIDAKKVIGRISPRPIFLMQGGADRVVSPDSGEKLYEAAGQPKTLWFDPALGHARFFDDRRAEYERRVVGFLDHAMLGR